MNMGQTHDLLHLNPQSTIVEASMLVITLGDFKSPALQIWHMSLSILLCLQHYFHTIVKFQRYLTWS